MASGKHIAHMPLDDSVPWFNIGSLQEYKTASHCLAPQVWRHRAEGWPTHVEWDTVSEYVPYEGTYQEDKLVIGTNQDPENVLIYGV